MPRRPRELGTPQSPADYFGAELRAFREAAGLSRPQLADQLGYTAQWIGQIEQRKSTPSEEFARDCDTFFTTNGTFHRLWEWLKHLGQLQLLPPGFPDFVDREAEAIVMYMFEAMAVTGLFQTREYAYEVLKAGRTPEAIEQLVVTRMSRQGILTSEDPPRVVVVFDEGAIRRPIGGAELMRHQVGHLIALAERPAITMQIVPQSRGAYAGLPGAFTLLGFRSSPDVAYIEGHVGGQLIDHSETVREYALRFDLIRGAAMSADESLKTLHGILESL
ncbi:helix-turn-helix domain-containing protein [Actinomadura alba]|uniref:Helix-turn-helix domain-containing protein n=2 Tax=Actinomadura alba TaxID=406431 RepID=A0ABR7LGW8_9ACTN|nr:helix-turn-helix domain-containing protein [Actinomadura alba]